MFANGWLNQFGLVDIGVGGNYAQYAESIAPFLKKDG